MTDTERGDVAANGLKALVAFDERLAAIALAVRAGSMDADVAVINICHAWRDSSHVISFGLGAAAMP